MFFPSLCSGSHPDGNSLFAPSLSLQTPQFSTIFDHEVLYYPVNSLDLIPSIFQLPVLIGKIYSSWFCWFGWWQNILSSCFKFPSSPWLQNNMYLISLHSLFCLAHFAHLLVSLLCSNVLAIYVLVLVV